MLRVVAMAASEGAYDAITAEWADIAVASPSTSGTNAAVEIRFTDGTTRTLLINYYGVGTLYRKKNAEAYDVVGPNESVSVVTTDDLEFKYENTVNINETRTVSVYDQTGGRTISTFTVSYSGGTDGGVGGGDGGGGFDPGGGGGDPD